jgi:hypothetical protein
MFPRSEDAREDLLSSPDGGAIGGGKCWSLPNRRARAALESLPDQRRPRAGAWQSYAVRHSRTAHDLYSARICYRYHPRYGTTVQLIRHLRHGSAAIMVVRLVDGSQLAIPEWMLKPEACQELKVEAKPRISVSALLDVCQLIGVHASAVADNSHICAESAAGGRDAQQGESSDTTAQPSVRGRRALDQVSRIGSGALSKSLEGTTGERSEEG